MNLFEEKENGFAPGYTTYARVVSKTHWPWLFFYFKRLQPNDT